MCSEKNLGNNFYQASKLFVVYPVLLTVIIILLPRINLKVGIVTVSHGES